MTRSTRFAVVLLLGSLGSVRADDPPGPMLDAASRDALSATIRGILVESLPEKITGQDDWGETKRGFSGLTWRLDGLKLEVEKREKDVKNGLWKRWEIVPVDPARNLLFRIDSAQSTGPTRFTFRIVAASPLTVSAHFERWRSGVKMLNGTIDADATVAAALVGDLEYRFETSDGRTHAVIAPRVTAVDLALVDMRWKRISKLDGPGVRELGELLDPALRDQLDKQEPKAVEKLNAAIVKRQEKLRISMPAPLDLSRWSIKAGELIDALK
jgi:hypothetical protein